MNTKEECDERARMDWELARRAELSGDMMMASEDRRRALDWERARDSWCNT